ncbi:hypothetical protein P171DRAFT_490574 [Karstenula rhodostoma CBS 690.94]|uniref:Protein kinase domain-containing protein n=1 Tax=Karstenula rhodostoma CBS 690.94 TaxID=1392251 RepID=A0A9P4P845_9PLEO|nr:hypothetical protein P171DRAFT_490574 [Karstenula rhodostoma CBS 690.94]
MSDKHRATSARPHGHTFDRLPRPQRIFDPTLAVPTKVALEVMARQSNESLQPMRPPPKPPINRSPKVNASSSSERREFHVSADTALPATDLRRPLSQPDEPPRKLGLVITLGTFTQDGQEWDVRAQRGRRGLIMVKKRDRAPGSVEKEAHSVSKHENIINLLGVVLQGEIIELSFEYSRFTLAQVLHVHLKLEERHIQCIAHAVFGALDHLAQHRMMHHNVQAKTIRFTTPDIRIVLSDFEAVTADKGSRTDSSDLIDLGFVLLECMEGRILPAEKRSKDFILEQRTANRVFGLTNAEIWSGCQDLIDFLDELFNERRTVSARYSRHHPFVSSQVDYECMRPYIELVSLECHTSWVPEE